MDAVRSYPHEDFVVADGGPGDLLKPEDVLRYGAVRVLDDRLHRLGVGALGLRLDRVIERCGLLRRFVLRVHRVPIEVSWESGVMRRPRITSQSANTNSPMPVIADTSD